MNLLLVDHAGTPLVNFLKKVDLKFVVDNIALVWKELNPQTLENASHKLLGRLEE